MTHAEAQMVRERPARVRTTNQKIHFRVMRGHSYGSARSAAACDETPKGHTPILSPDIAKVTCPKCQAAYARHQRSPA